MTTAPDSPTQRRDAVLAALLPLIPSKGWTESAIAAALRATGLAAAEAPILFPRGPVSAIMAWFDHLDRTMAESAGDLSGLRTTDRIRTLVAAWLRAAAPHKTALARAMAILTLPWQSDLAVRAIARTADAMWQAAHDRSQDLSWYTRRFSLATIFAATLLYWLRDESEEITPALDFFDRRLDDLSRVGRWRRRLTAPLPLRWRCAAQDRSASPS